MNEKNTIIIPVEKPNQDEKKIFSEHINDSKHIIFSITNYTQNNFNAFDALISIYMPDTETLLENLYSIFKEMNHSGNLFLKGIRNNTNWGGAATLMVDCDDGYTIKEAQEKLDSLGINYIIAPSKSHLKLKKNKECERFHVYIPLSKPIKDQNQFDTNINYFIELLSGDKGAKDRARFFANNPNLKFKDIIIENKKLNFNPIIYKKKEKIEQEETVIPDFSFDDEKSEKIIVTSEQVGLFLTQVKNMHPQLIFSHFNKSNQSLNFKRNHLDKGPGLFCTIDMRYILDPSNQEIYSLQYSLKDFATIKEVNSERMRIQVLIPKLNEIISDFENNKNLGQVYVLKTNEGTGKSRAVSEILKPGHFFTFDTKVKMMEDYTKFKERNIPVKIIYANSDLIFNCIFANRGLTDEAKLEAEKLAKEYTKYYSRVENKCKKAEISDDDFNLFFDLENINKEKVKNEIIKKLQIIYKSPDGEFLKTDSSYFISLLAFLKLCVENQVMYDEEMDMILGAYQEQIQSLFYKKEIFFCSTMKFRHLVKTIPDVLGKILCFQDEFTENVYNGTSIVANEDPNYKLKLAMASKHLLEETGYDDFSENIDFEQKTKIDMLKKKHHIVDWIYVECWKTVKQILEIKTIDWYKYNEISKENLTSEQLAEFEKYSFGNSVRIPLQLTTVILTTEDTPLYNMSGENPIDLSHNIYTPKLNIIYVPGLNQRKTEGLAYQGKDRLHITKAMASDHFEINEKYIIGNGFGHSKLNALYNHRNAKGTNNFKHDIESESTQQNVCIFTTWPHPETINKYKGILLPFIKIIAKEEGQNIYDIINDRNLEKTIISLILNDEIHQSLGRVLGYRESKNVKNVYLIVNEKLKDFLNLKYVTPNCFSLTPFEHSQDLRIKHTKIYTFLRDLTNTLNSPNENRLNITEMAGIYSMFPELFERFNYLLKKTMDMILNVKKRIKNFFSEIYNVSLLTQFERLRNIILLRNKNFITDHTTRIIGPPNILGFFRDIVKDSKVFNRYSAARTQFLINFS